MSLSPRESVTGGSSQQESPDLPPHLRNSVTRVPVTPGIQSSTYTSRTSPDSVKAASLGYFTRDPANQSSVCHNHLRQNLIQMDLLRRI